MAEIGFIVDVQQWKSPLKKETYFTSNPRQAYYYYGLADLEDRLFARGEIEVVQSPLTTSLFHKPPSPKHLSKALFPPPPYIEQCFFILIKAQGQNIVLKTLTVQDFE